MSIFVTAAALAFASPAHATPVTPTTKEVAEPDKEAEDEGEAEEATELSEEEIQAMMVVFERFMDAFFPAGPEPSAQQMSAARQSVDIMFPKGAYGEAMTEMIDELATRVLDMSEADMVAIFPSDENDEEESDEEKAKPKKELSTRPLREEWAAKDPQWEAKLAAGKALVVTMLTKMGEAFEPSIRDGMTRSMARRYDAKQLAEINRFLATPTGAKFGGDVIAIWFDRDVMRGMLRSFPEMIRMSQDMGLEIGALEALFSSGDDDDEDEEDSEAEDRDEDVEGEAA